ncbi:hypothetical protein [Trebonia kvetii]|uniref:hypothetical protein n=1 Tax=Trebonia kvetii TaxID=2480626 RepID=UPI001FEB8E50|nr:hypothetical protein [Trebonia kvetii]
MAKVVVLAGEGLERAQPVGVAALAWAYLDVEVAPEMGEVPFERGDVKRDSQAAQDPLHGEESAVLAKHRVHRVMRRGGLLD